MSANIKLAIGRLVRAIKRHLPIMGEDYSAQPPMMIHFADRDEPFGARAFADLLAQIPGGEEGEPSEDGQTRLPPDRLIRLLPPTIAVAAELSAAHAVLPTSDAEYDLLRGLLEELGKCPVFSWRWTGSTPAERRPDGTIQASLFSPVTWGYCRVDGPLLDALEGAANALPTDKGRSRTPRPKQTGKTPRPRSTVGRDKNQEARDKWIYQQCCKGKMMPLSKIVAELKRKTQKEKGWALISTIQGIRGAAVRHAKRNGLPPPPSRQNL